MKALLARLALLLGALVVGLWIAEKALDLVGYEYRPLAVELGDAGDVRYYHSFTDRAFVYDPRLIWSPRPGRGIFNHQGLRGPVLGPERREGSLRVIALGDSNTLGWAGADGANWPAVVGRLLRR